MRYKLESLMHVPLAFISIFSSCVALDNFLAIPKYQCITWPTPSHRHREGAIKSLAPSPLEGSPVPVVLL